MGGYLLMSLMLVSCTYDRAAPTTTPQELYPNEH
jgi:hypothetical protein